MNCGQNALKLMEKPEGKEKCWVHAYNCNDSLIKS